MATSNSANQHRSMSNEPLNVIIGSIRLVNWPTLFGGYLPIVSAVGIVLIAEPLAFKEFDDARFMVGILCLVYSVIVCNSLTRRVRDDVVPSQIQSTLPILLIASTTACTVHVAFAYVASWFDRTDPLFSTFVCVAFAIPAIALVVVASLGRAKNIGLVGWLLSLDFLLLCAFSAKSLIHLLNTHCTILWPQSILEVPGQIVFLNLVCLAVSVPAPMVAKWPHSASGLAILLASSAFAFICTGRIMEIAEGISVKGCTPFVPLW